MPLQENHCKNGVTLLQSIKGPMSPRIKSLRKDAEKGEVCENILPEKVHSTRNWKLEELMRGNLASEFFEIYQSRNRKVLERV